MAAAAAARRRQQQHSHGQDEEIRGGDHPRKVEQQDPAGPHQRVACVAGGGARGDDVDQEGATGCSTMAVHVQAVQWQEKCRQYESRLAR